MKLSLDPLCSQCLLKSKDVEYVAVATAINQVTISTAFLLYQGSQRDDIRYYTNEKIPVKIQDQLGFDAFRMQRFTFTDLQYNT